MEHPASGRANPEYTTPGNGDNNNHNSGRQNYGHTRTTSTDLLAPTPDIEFPASPPAPRRPQVSYAPTSPPPRETQTISPPTSFGLGIGPTAQHSQHLHTTQYYGNGYYNISRDTLQQDGEDDDSPPTSPPPANYASKSGATAHAYPLDTMRSGDGAGGYYYHPSHGGGDGNGKNPFDDPSPSPGGPPHPKRSFPLWRLAVGGWRMYGLFLFGFACAVGHHAFYSSLDGKPADDQIKMMRFGGLLSYAAKAGLLAAVIFAYQQQVWVTAIHNTMRLRAVDSLFAASNEPHALLNWEFVRKARVATALAVAAWLFPLTVILTPATLSVAPMTTVEHTTCPGVRTLNFEHETTKNWRILNRINGFRDISMSLWNCTMWDSSDMIDRNFSSDFFDYWTGGSAQLDLVTAQSGLTGAVIPRWGASLETCGGGWNCSYVINFVAPGYKCTELARGQTLDKPALDKQGVAFDVSALVPEGDWGYAAITHMGDYYPEQVAVGGGGRPEKDPPYPPHLGVFRTEPVLWIGHTEYKGPANKSPPMSRTDPHWNTYFEAVVTRCEHYVVNYTVQFNHTATQQTTTVLSRTYLHPVIDTTYDPNRNADDGTFDNTTAVPESNYIYPLDVARYRLTAAYHGLGERMRAFLDGRIRYTPYATVDSDITKTVLMDTETYLPVPNLISSIQTFYENMTLSLLSNPQFVVVAWAADPSRRSGLTVRPAGTDHLRLLNHTDSDPRDPSIAYPCTRTRIANAYVFNRRDLWIAYAAASGAALAAVILGSAALSQNGFRERDTRLSSVVAATRAPCLGALPWEGHKNTPLTTAIPLNGPHTSAVTNPLNLGMWMGGVGSAQGVMAAAAAGGSSRVYYGFAPREVLERSRVAVFGTGSGADTRHGGKGGVEGGGDEGVRKRKRMSAWSFRNWEERWREGG
ncbi:uncharacterized protein C8A04DRAFT_40938 [Dichotomopilus funicola]|uniref:Formylmethionine deformylase-like protein n=1 Tax=Dichotomopilus funicola TaxID=1934379 RepID=A0AAN6ZIU0_9PEZI|nr:hypothetical protein C8A04DRAFT_40938 [Dichotomopilus funicola]